MIDDQQSPMFIHALESFEHGIFHYLEGGDKDRKFAFLHLDQAVELLLKEKAVRIGKSIYKKDNTTLNFHEVFKSLENAAVKVEEKPRLEEVHDLRNNIQHKGITPDERTTEFYAKIVYKFVKRFLREELDTSLEDCLSVRYRKKMEGIKDTLDLKEASKLFWGYYEDLSLDPQEKVMTTFVLLEKYIKGQWTEEDGTLRGAIRRLMLERGLFFKDYKSEIDQIFDLRNRVLHKGETPSELGIKEYLTAMEIVLKALVAPEKI